MFFMWPNIDVFCCWLNAHIDTHIDASHHEFSASAQYTIFMFDLLLNQRENSF